MGPDREPAGSQARGLDETTPLLRDNDPEPIPDEVQVPARTSERRQQYWISLVFGLLLALTFTLVVVFLALHRSSTMQPSSALCLTPACIHAADQFLMGLSPNYRDVNPCTDFEELVCGGWRAHHDRRPDQSTIGALSLMADEGQTTLRHILESPYPGESSHSSFSPLNLAVALGNTDQDNFNLLQRAYNACMAENEIKKIGIKPVQDLLDAFPVIKDAKNLSEPILYLEKLGISSFVSLGPSADAKDPDTVVIYASPRGRYGFSNPNYKNKDILSQYQDVLTQIFGSIYPNPTARSAASKKAAALVTLESQLAAAAPPPEDLQDVTKSYTPMSLKDTVALAPALGLDHVLMSLVPEQYRIDQMITEFPAFFTNVSAILSATSLETIQDFFYWRLISASANLVVAPELKPWEQFVNKLSGKDADATPERWRTCSDIMDESLTWFLSRFYIEAAFSEKAKELGDKIVSEIKDQFTSSLKNLEWMDDSVKKLAAQKVKAIDQKIGYPTKSPNIMDPDALKQYYSGLVITDSFYNNSMSTQQFSVHQSWSALGHPVNRNEWFMSASTVNAYYNPPGNEIVFPAGIMNFPTFGVDLPMYINYGAFGAVAGHELSHAFDNNGRHYDVNGRAADWWTNKTVEEFEKRAQCFVDEYGNLTVVGTSGPEHVNGRLTLGENIADAGGLAASFEIWKRHMAEDPDLMLPGLDFFTPEQLFYVAYGNTWCSKSTKEYLTQLLLTNPHSPAEIRIKGAATMNSKGFREAFNCPVKEPVCKLW